MAHTYLNIIQYNNLQFHYFDKHYKDYHRFFHNYYHCKTLRHHKFEYILGHIIKVFKLDNINNWPQKYPPVSKHCKTIFNISCSHQQNMK